MPKRQYSDDFKREAVKLVEAGRSKPEVARALGVARKTLHDWGQQFGSKARGESAHEADELKQLREENRQLRMERQILKKATAFFANPNK
jgi:transposase